MTHQQKWTHLRIGSSVFMTVVMETRELHKQSKGVAH